MKNSKGTVTIVDVENAKDNKITLTGRESLFWIKVQEVVSEEDKF